MSPKLRKLVDECHRELDLHLPHCDKCKNGKTEECGFFMNLARKILHFGKLDPIPKIPDISGD